MIVFILHMINYIKNYLLFILSIGIAFSVNIKGTITDIDTNEPLIGANVYIEGTSKGSATDANGSYFISDVRSCSTCKYKLKVMYIGYEQYEKSIEAFNNVDIISDLKLKTASIETATTKITAKKRQDKVIDAPAAIELVSASDIKKEESTNLGSYLKGIKGVDFTSSGVNNYSISVRGFNSSFSSRLLTLTDGRVASIPALRVVNYSTVPQSSKDIESIEVVIGPATALYGANAHSGVVNITSKSPAVSEGIDISASSSINDDRDLYKFSTRWAHKISDKLSFKLSGMYLEAYEWEFISDEEYKRHKYPWNGHPSRTIDKKDNNPWGLTTHYWDLVAKDSTYHNYYTGDADIEYDEYVDSEADCRTIEGYECELVEKYIGDGEPNDTGDPDNDGVMGEDWYNGYDDDGDVPTVPTAEVIALPDGNTTNSGSASAVPKEISSWGSLAATTVTCESPDIEKVPIDEVVATPVTDIFWSVASVSVPKEALSAWPVRANEPPTAPHCCSFHPIEPPVFTSVSRFQPVVDVTDCDSSPIEEVRALPVTDMFWSVATVSVPILNVREFPEGFTSAIPTAVKVPAVDVKPIPVTDMFWSVATVSVPRDDVRPLPVTETGACWFHAPLFQVSRPHPWIEAMFYLLCDS